MKTKITLLFLLVVLNVTSKAQSYVTIPDANFVAWLNTVIPSCMNGNQMDTNNTTVQTLNSIYLGAASINDLTGIQYFSALQTLDCSDNQLTSLPSLPINLGELKCNNNNLNSLPNLPASLQHLECSHNNLTSLPSLPINLQIFICDQNQLLNLPSLPNSIMSFNCSNNNLTSLQSLPPNLYQFDCSYNNLTSMPTIPLNINVFRCDHNQLTTIPNLPNNSYQLFCSYNNLTSLPNFAANLEYLYCENNQLTSLPSLPNNLHAFNCINNNISCFPVFPNSLTNASLFSIIGNPFTCLPNYVSAMNAGTLAYPLCFYGDSINNISNCPSANGIVGYINKDNNINCIKDTGDLNVVNFPIKLYDNSNNLFGQTYSLSNGIYDFPVSESTFTVKIDTLNMPFTVQCVSGIDSTVSLTYSNPIVTDVNFAIDCKPGFDIGIQSVINSGQVFPGQQHSLSVLAGDMSNWYNLNCAAGISGQIQVTITGPVTYTGITFGAITPTIVGNIFTYTIADFGTINNSLAFGLLFTTDTNAQTGDTICLNVIVTPTNGDNNISNNTFNYCYQVVNSYDPNFKEVYPVNVLPTYHDWFTYSIHFQNTGATAAHNIRLVDALSNNLDLETFQVINYSHHNTVSLQGNVLTFRFPNIMLPDSTSDQEGSKGFVQYRIKPKPNLVEGTQINNSANIYFDYNPPIITNTTTNVFTQFVTVHESKMNISLSVYPNPSNGKYYVKLSEGMKGSEINIKVYNLLGELILNTKTQSSLSQIDLSHQPNGIYIIRVNDSNQSFNQRLIKQ